MAKNAWQSLAPLVAFLLAYQGELINKLILGGAGFILVITTAAFLSYWFFTFRISSDSILIRQGVIRKKQLDIKFERIQAVNIEQNLVYRLLGLVTLGFDTAGSAGNEGNLPAVTRDFAEDLRAHIKRKPDSSETTLVGDSQAAEALLHLDWRDMIRIGLTDRRVLLVFAVAGPMSNRIEVDGKQLALEITEFAAGFGIPMDTANMVSIGLVMILLLIVFLALVSIVGAFLKYHDFQLFLDHQTLRSVGGLFTRHERSMDLGKIQTLRLQQGIVQRLMGRFTMSARQAVSGGRGRSKKVFEIPLVTTPFADQLRKSVLAPEGGTLSQDPGSDQFVSISAYSMRTPILFIGLLPAVSATLALWPQLERFSLLCLVWIPAVAAFAFRRWRRAGYQHDNNEIIRRSGLFGYRTVALLFRKIQRVSVTQSSFQRRKNLASVRMYMASGTVRIPYIDHTTAKQLRDYMLYKVESSRQAWH